jgi:hypothetical protein
MAIAMVMVIEGAILMKIVMAMEMVMVVVMAVEWVVETALLMVLQRVGWMVASTEN